VGTQEKEKMRVLVSFNITELLENPTQYLLYKQEYLNSYGDFSVPTFVEVEEMSQANRLYSKRECMTVAPKGVETSGVTYTRDNRPKRGIPAVSEDNIDAGRRVYQYYNPFTNSDNEIIYKYKEAINSAGQIVKLCYENGNYLTQIDPPSNVYYFNIRQMIENNIDYSSLVPAPLLAPDYIAEARNDDFSTYLQNIIDPYYVSGEISGATLWGQNRKTLIKYIEFTSDQPTLNLNVDNFNFIISGYFIHPLKNAENGLNPSGAFYTVPATSDQFTDKHYQPMYASADVGYEEWADLRESVEKIEGPFIKGRKDLSDRWDLIRYSDLGISGVSGYTVYDKLLHIIPLRSQENIYLNFNVPYLFKNGLQSYSNYTFDFDTDKRLQEFDESYRLTTVHIPSHGYGGSRNNASWDEIRPEENDYIAFDEDEGHNFLVRNTKDEYVYLSDLDGVREVYRNGLFWLNTNEDLELSYNRLFQEKQTVKFYFNREDIDETNKIINVFDYESYHYEPSEYNFYKLPLTPIDIYIPRTGTDENNNEYGVLTPVDISGIVYLSHIKFYKAGLQIDGDRLEAYQFSFYNKDDDQLPGVYFDYTDDIIKVSGYVINDGVLSGADTYTLKDDLIKMKMIHGGSSIISGTYQERDYNLSVEEKKLNSEFFVKSVTSIRYDDDTYIGDNSIILELLTGTLVNEGEAGNKTLIESKDENIITVKNSFVDNKTTLYVRSKPINEYVLINSTDRINLDIQDYNLKTLTDKDWISGHAESIEVKVDLYTGDQYISGNITPTREGDDIDEPYRYYVTFNNTKKYLDLTVRSDLTELNISGQYIYTWDSDDTKTKKVFTYKNLNGVHSFVESPSSLLTDQNKILIAGLPGNVIFNRPKYKNVKELIEEEKLIINYKVPKIRYTYPNGENSIMNIDESLSFFHLRNAIKLDNIYLKIRVLPVQTITPEIRYMNHPDYIHEVDIHEKDFFGYDRVWINTNINGNPPIIYKKELFNKESEFDYYQNTWKNKDGYKVFICDEAGHFTMPGKLGGLVLFTRLDEKLDGDCREVIYGKVDPRFNLPEIIYKTSTEKYRNSFYIEGSEINPIVATISIKDEFNSITQQFDYRIQVLQKKKAGNLIDYVEADSTYIQDISKIIKYEIVGEEVHQNEYTPFVDYINGVVNFILRGPTNLYEYDNYGYFYGIKYYNTFNINDGNLKDYWVLKTDVDNRFKSSFYINTKENIIDKKNKEYGVVEITEVGVFDQYNRLCAYLSHPKVQYRSDTQHIAYSLLISEN
jgi:hypothetical protein